MGMSFMLQVFDHKPKKTAWQVKRLTWWRKASFHPTMFPIRSHNNSSGRKKERKFGWRKKNQSERVSPRLSVQPEPRAGIASELGPFHAHGVNSRSPPSPPLQKTPQKRGLASTDLQRICQEHQPAEVVFRWGQQRAQQLGHNEAFRHLFSHRVAPAPVCFHQMFHVFFPPKASAAKMEGWERWWGGGGRLL